IGEANFSDHGANRLGASALMQGLADGYFVLPYTLQNYLADEIYTSKPTTDTVEFEKAETEVKLRINNLLAVGGTKPVDYFHRKLGLIMWENVGMGRTAESLEKALGAIDELQKEFENDVLVPGSNEQMNPELEKALRLADYFELAKLIATDALHRNESCGGHFRIEHQTADGETQRNDNDYMYVAAWQYSGKGEKETLYKEPLEYQDIEIKQRNYK
ncbi:MAG: fumarate reductase/succinate dehydrogenase flavoprotein subunit, partial [Bacteroidales bacterium]|nr:fumarate reductase/succinate dehydrogenase flavoprotein subunit [Bacteroidales bacterium]